MDPISQMYFLYKSQLYLKLVLQMFHYTVVLMVLNSCFMVLNRREYLALCMVGKVNQVLPGCHVNFLLKKSDV